LENVAAIKSNGLETVVKDLAIMGYDSRWLCIRASDVGAPHHRDRWFLLSDSGKLGRYNGGHNREERHVYGNQEWNVEKIQPERNEREHRVSEVCEILANTKSKLGNGCNNNTRVSMESYSESEFRNNSWQNNVANTTSKGLERGTRESLQGTGTRFTKHGSNEYASDSNSEMLEYGNREGETFRRTIKKKRTKSSSGSREWEAFPTVSPICNGDDGLSNRLDSITFPKWRNESIKAGGNAIVPQVVYQIFKAIEEYNQLDKQLSI
jgi:DNA (cytosine-5)-methyltransferase 1